MKASVGVDLQRRRFLLGLFGAAPAASFVLVWTLPGRCSRWFPVARLAQAAATMAELARTRDVYVGCGLRGRDHGVHVRGGATDVVAIPGAWADVDCTKPGATKPYFATREAAGTFLDALPLRPTLRVWSGGGYQAWWLFREPWVFADGIERTKAATVLRCWQAHLRESAGHLGATLDATHDLARVLRAAGTVNHKWHLPVVLEVDDGPRCNPGDLEELVVDLPSLGEGPPPRNHRGGEVGDLDDLHETALALDRNANPPPAKLAALLARDRRFRRTWVRQRPDLVDQSPSAYDLALATAAARAGWDDTEIIGLLIAHRRRHGSPPKLRADYYARTLARARAARLPQQPPRGARRIVEVG
jgi:hypothetical protein